MKRHNVFLRATYRLFTAEYGFPSWILAYVSTSFGIILWLLLLSGDGPIKEFLHPLPFGGWLWAVGLIIGGASAMFGMAKSKVRWVRRGAFLSFTAWLYGLIAFIANGDYLNVIIIIVPIILFWAYKYMASYIREGYTYK